MKLLIRWIPVGETPQLFGRIITSCNNFTPSGFCSLLMFLVLY